MKQISPPRRKHAEEDAAPAPGALPPAPAPAETQDLAPLAWVIDEIRTSLGEAANSAKAFLGNKADSDYLRVATEQVHQVSGALQLLNLRGVNLVTEAVEQLLGQWAVQPNQCMPAAVRTVDATLCAVRNYLDAMLAGRASPPIRLFPYYREVLVLLGAPRINPADLVFPDLSRRPPVQQMTVRTLSADELRIRRVHYEEGLLRFLRDPDDVSARGRMRDAVRNLEGLPQRGLARSFWWVARALFDALDSFQVPVDADLKRFLARLNQQLRRQVDGGPAVAERLMIDALYHVARADERIERVTEVKQLYGLATLIPPDFDRATLTTIDTEGLAALKESLNQCKLLWSQLAAGGAADATRFRDEVGRAQASALRLGAAAPARVLGCIGEVTAQLARASSEMRDTLAIEVATALLLLENGADSFPQADPQFEQRADAMIERIMRAGGGMPLPEGDTWVEDLARQAHERSSMDTVVTEMRTMLREAELRLDRFFRNPAQREDLAELGPLLEQVSGVLGVLGFEEPAAALRNVKESVLRFADPSKPVNAAEFPRIAQNLGAVGFLVAELTQNPSQPRGIFHFDRRTGSFTADMAVAPAVPPDTDDAEAEAPPAPLAANDEPEAAAENVEHSIERLLSSARAATDALASRPNDATAIAALGLILAQLGNDAELTDDTALRKRTAEAARLLELLQRGGAGAPAAAGALQALLRPAVVEVPEPTAPMPASASAADRELHEIFIEEADEVLESVGAQLARLQREPEDGATITMARRAFHTLKGSSRMVGLRDFGEFAWAIEQCFNVWLAQERPANADLLGVATASADCMRDWIEALRVDPAAHVDAGALIAAANVVRDGGRFELPYPADQVSAASAAVEVIELVAPPPEEPPPAAAASAAAAPVSAPAPAAPRAGSAPAAAEPEDDARRIGPLLISHGLYSVFITESDECVRALGQDIAEWRYEPARAVGAALVRRAHTLAGIADTVGLGPVSSIADPLDALLHQLFERRPGNSAELSQPQFDVLERAVERMRGMLHQFAAGAYPDHAPHEAGALRDLVVELQAQERFSAVQDLAAAAPVAAPARAAGPYADTVPVSNGLPELSLAVPSPAPAAPAPPPPAPPPAPPSVASAPVASAPVVPAPPRPTVVAPVPPPKPVASAPPPGAPPVPVPARPPAGPAAPAPATPAAPVLATLAPAAAAAAPAPQAIAPATPALPAAPAELSSYEAVAPTPVRDEIDEQLLQVFTIEAQDLLPAIAKALRALAQNPNQRDAARDLMRHLHTLKGSARMAGAMRLGELVHDMETRIESAMQLASLTVPVIEDLQGQYDQALALFEALLQGPGFQAAGQAPRAAEAHAPAAAAAAAPIEAAAPGASHSFGGPAAAGTEPEATRSAIASVPFIRVRADVVDRLVDHAGEVSIARSKLESEVATLRGSLADLTENIQRLRSQLREVELQADAQIQARSDQVAKQTSNFDPLEFDRYSRLQELTRLIAESVEDVALVQSNMLKGLQLADNDLSAQSRLTRELQQQLMRVRLVPFSNVSERLYRVARQAAKELQKRAHLDIVGGETEIDRSLLEQMAGPFEHLVRNAIVHGLEAPAARLGAGKSDTGELRIEVRREGNEIVVVFADDGAGLDLERIRARALSAGILSPERRFEEREIVELIFAPGLSTAQEVTELAGRGVGMDVVREQVSSLGGRISVSTERGKGTRFTLYLPMTLSIMQVVLASVGERRYALPAAMVEQARRVRAREMVQALQHGSISFGDQLGEVTLRPLAQLLGSETVINAGEQYSVALLRLGDDRLAVCVDDLSANQEVVVKSVGPQVARLAGVLGATVLGNGQVVLIINPVQLIGRAPEPPTLDGFADAGDAARTPSARGGRGVAGATIMVVDDSLTVRRVTQRLLERNGYRTILAKDGVDAMRELQEATPDVMLIDIEMPRMDGYDLTRNVRASSATRNIPIIMITSRTAEKHRRVAFELGVNEYLGKPYREDELLELIQRYTETARALRAESALRAGA